MEPADHVAGLAQTCRDVMERVGASQALVVSNNTALMGMFKDAMATTVQTTDPVGSVDGANDDWSYGHERNSMYKDALLDAMLLARCNYIVAAPSNLATMALILNPGAEIVLPEHLRNIAGL
jgi:hypothetical protein